MNPAPSLLRTALRAVASLSLALLAACGGGAGRDAVAPRAAPLVEAVEARFGSLAVAETVPGMVRARNQVEIRPEIDGRVVEVMARSGDAVRSGQALVRLDGSEARERLRQAEADVAVQEASLASARARVAEIEARVARTRKLAAEELVSVQELETMEAQLAALEASAAEAAARIEQARATVEERRSALAKTLVRAPVAGRLGERRVEVGMLVDSSDVLFVVGDLSELIVEVPLTEELLARVEEGLPVVISPRRGAGEPVEATLTRISPFLAEESFTTVGEIDVDNPAGALRPGMFVSVRILVGQTRQATLVPVTAVWEDPESGDRGVFVIEETAGLEAPPAGAEPPGAAAPNPQEERPVAFRRVEVLAEGGGKAGVAGIDEGTWVVTVGQHLLGAELRARLTGGAEAADGAAAPPSEARVTARVRPVSWARVLELQSLQSEDLLEGFLDKQRKLAEALGAEIPESEDVVDRVLDEAGGG